MFALQILSPEGEVYSDSIDEVLLPTPDGEISILTHHVPLFSKLAEGTLTIRKGDKRFIIALLGGFLEVKKNVVTILSDYAVRAESIQAAQSLDAKKMAEEIIAKKESTAELITAEKNLQKSLLELKVANKVKHQN